jgi:NAD+ diphosphatase
MSPWNRTSIIDHDETARRADSVQSVWESGDVRVLQLDSHGQFDAQNLGVPPASGQLPDDVAYLGRVSGVAWFAQRVERSFPDTVRSAQLDDAGLALVMSANAILNWQAAARHCTWCGGRLVLAPGSFSAKCSECGRETFPRTDPAVIVALVNDDDELYLSHQVLWQPGFVSITAGFVDSGESAENAVAREVAEESGLTVRDVRFVGSQPWPFPRSLMLGYLGLAEGQPEVDGDEIGWGAWFSRETLAGRIAAGELYLAPPASIARRLIDAWIDHRIGRATFSLS